MRVSAQTGETVSFAITRTYTCKQSRLQGQGGPMDTKTILVIAGILFILAGIAGQTVKGFGVELSPIASRDRQVLLVVVGAILIWVGFGLPVPKRSVQAQESLPSKSSSTSSLLQPSAQPERSPEETISAYLQALSLRDLRTAQQLKPSLSPEQVRSWLEGGSSGKSPIQLASLVSSDRVETGSTRITIQAHVLYCRKDGTATNEQKRYILAVNPRKAWEIRVEYQPDKVVGTHC
jgi:hypothetical protein